MDKARECEYGIFISDVGICCKAYYKSKRPDGKDWMHFPVCTEPNCPLVHSELLEGATLESNKPQVIKCAAFLPMDDYAKKRTID